MNKKKIFREKLEAQIKELMELTGLSQSEVLQEMKLRLKEDQNKSYESQPKN